MTHHFHAHCPCGYEATVHAGGNATTHYYWPYGCKHCRKLFTKNLLDSEPIACPGCGSTEMIDYNIAYNGAPRDHTIYYGHCHQLKLDLILPGYKYPQPCPSCGESTLVFGGGKIST